MSSVLICGEGIAASCCSRLLAVAGFQVTAESGHRSRLPAIMLGETAQKIFCDVFGRQNLFADLPRISRRVVLWGTSDIATTVPHSAVVVSEKSLLDRIHSEFRLAETTTGTSPDWTVFAGTRVPPSSLEHHFGDRPAKASAVTLGKGCDTESCWIESSENGWLFLLPGENRDGWLLSVGDTPEALLAESRLIDRLVSSVSPSPGTFLSHPRLIFPLSAPGWLACGTGAMRFDPICGDGAANAMREAILGSAVIRASTGSGDTDSLIDHYQARLLGGFQRHLSMCLEFYKLGGRGAWWDAQLDDLRRGISWCSHQLQKSNGAGYRLHGFELSRA